MADRHRPNAPGGYYRSKANQKLIPYKVDLRADTLMAWKQAVLCMGMSQRQAQAVEYVFRALARGQGIDIPAHPGPLPNRPKPPPLDC
jgi:hypothetical protein